MNDNKDIISRLKKVEGQVRGIQKMLDEGRYCVEILLQINAAKAGLHKAGLQLLERHTKGCVSKAFKEDRGDVAIQELIEVIEKFIK